MPPTAETFTPTDRSAPARAQDHTHLTRDITAQDHRAARTAEKQRTSESHQSLVAAGTLPDTQFAAPAADTTTAGTPTGDQASLRIPGNTKDTVGDAHPDTAPDRQLATERAAVDAAAEKKIHDPAALKQFRSDMEFFESRARSQGLSSSEIASTYHQVDRLLGSSGTTPLTDQQRTGLAQDVMHQAAHPLDIRQGSANTCVYASLEKRAYTLHPSEAAKVVADMAINQQYKLEDGKTVTIDKDTLTQRAGGARSLASQIFQASAINTKLVSSGAADGERYEQHKPDPNVLGDTGERIVLHNEQPPISDPMTQPDVRDTKGLEHTYQLLTHSKESGFSFEFSQGDSQQKFDQRLQDLQQRGQLPATLAVLSAHEPWKSDMGPDAMHDVAITGYDPATHKVTLSDANHAGTLTVSSEQARSFMHLPPMSDAEMADQVSRRFPPGTKPSHDDLKMLEGMILPQDQQRLSEALKKLTGYRPQDVLSRQELHELGL